MRRRHVPVAERRGSIFVLTEPDDFGHFLLEIIPIERLLRRAVNRDRARRIVNRVAAEDKKLLNAAGIDFTRQLKDAVHARSGRQLAQQNGRTDVFQRGIDSVNH